MSNLIVLSQKDIAEICNLTQAGAGYRLKHGLLGDIVQNCRGRVVGIEVRTFAKYAKNHNIELPDFAKKALASLSSDQNEKGE